jgi:hypothetical protein
MVKKETITKIQKCVEIAIPICAVIATFGGIDAVAYTTAIGTAIIYVLEAVKVFIKE